MGFLDALNTAATPVAVGAEAGQGIFNFFQEASNERWRRHAQELTWQREDNAVQRRVRDLQAAGLSPVLAAGGAASTSGPISTAAPSLDLGAVDSARMIADKVKMKADISRTEAETAITRAQGEKAEFERKVWEKLNGYKAEMGGTLDHPLTDKLALQTAQALLDQQEGISAQAKAAMTTAAALDRRLKFDMEHNLYSDEARDNQALSTWMSSAKGKDFIGPASQVGLDLLNMILSKRIPGRVPQR